MTLATSSSPPEPGPADFDLPAIFQVGSFDFTKPIALVVLAAVITVVLFSVMSRKAAVVPSRMQYAGELAYGFVRDEIARDNIGSKDFMRFVPYLFSIFLFVLINNFFGVVPFLQFPPMSHIAFPISIALLTWFMYNIAGISKHGFIGYLKHQTVPTGMSGPILLMLVPLEFFSNILVRPFTLALRLFATMFAGHLLILLFSLAAEYLLFHSDNALALPAGGLSIVLAILISFLDMLIMFLQAYVFTLLSAMYIGEALADEH